MQEKLEILAREHQELNQRLADPVVSADHNEVIRISQRLAEIKPVVDTWEAWRSAVDSLDEAHQILADSADPELRQLAQDELDGLKSEVERLEGELQIHLTPTDPNDDKNIVLEIRAGTGGDEAGLFAADLYRMYLRFAERERWNVSELERSESGIGGIREVIAVVEGHGAYSRLKFESGVHRVQRIPETESQGRIHTSAVTVAILPEADEIDVEIDSNDLRIDTFRSQGAGGQHVNTTDSAIRITHIPTGLVVSCQDEKSQHKNKAKALRVLRARLQEHFESEAHAERAAERKGLVGSGDRSERIRTYNFPQNRVTDHRINLTLHKLDQVIEGSLDELFAALAAADMAERLANPGE